MDAPKQLLTDDERQEAERLRLPRLSIIGPGTLLSIENASTGQKTDFVLPIGENEIVLFTM